jgi:hypothetical protein
MVKLLACSALVLCALSGCSAMPQHQDSASACAQNPGGYDCQIERYQRAPG